MSPRRPDEEGMGLADSCSRMLEEAAVAATPGVDFDLFHGRNFLRFCYAGSAAEMQEAVERIGNWLRRG